MVHRLKDYGHHHRIIGILKSREIFIPMNGWWWDKLSFDSTPDLVSAIRPIHFYPLFNGNFRILKWRYCTIFLANFSGDIPANIGLKNRPYIWNRYLQSIGSVGSCCVAVDRAVIHQHIHLSAPGHIWRIQPHWILRRACHPWRTGWRRPNMLFSRSLESWLIRE